MYIGINYIGSFLTQKIHIVDFVFMPLSKEKNTNYGFLCYLIVMNTHENHKKSMIFEQIRFRLTHTVRRDQQW